MALLFHLSAGSVLPFWVAMILFPGATLTKTLVRSPWIILPPVLCYVAFGAPHAGELLAVFARPSPESLATVMAKPWAASMFWAYAGAFDLFVGRWIFLDAVERGIRHRWVAPALVVAVFFGPVGFLIYALVRVAHAPARTEP